jgi:predicted RND superfamily exporter protein
MAYRKVMPVILAVLPTAAAGGAACGLLAMTGTLSSPLTVLLGGVIIAFATEFSVLWLGRFRAELRIGVEPAEAAATTSARMSPAILASALALIAGFGVLGLSPVPAVREFGIWSALDLALATIAVLALLPSLARAWAASSARAVRPALSSPQPLAGRAP